MRRDHWPSLILSLVFGCAAPNDKSDTAAPSPDDSAAPEVDLLTELDQPGPYSAGFRELSLDYDSSEGPRTLRLAVWYPTLTAPDEEHRYNGLVVTDNVAVNAPVAELDAPAPVHVYSHGHQGYAEASGFLMEHFATHGQIVFAPDHTGNTTTDGSRTTEIYYLRAEDISAVLDAVEQPTDRIDFLAGRMDAAHITASGHSFGGYTLHALMGATFDAALIDACLAGTDTTEYCSTMDATKAATLQGGLADPRIEGVVSMAPGDARLFGDSGLAAIDRPVLHMTGDLDPQTGAVAEDIWGPLSESGLHRRVDIAGGGHQTFTDYSARLETFDGLIDRDIGFRIVRTYALGWVWTIHGDTRARGLFDGTQDVDPAAILMQ